MEFVTQPVGKTLYVWGGGHNWSDATRKGISPKWKQWYDSNSSSYNYRYYMDLSEATEQKGLDCSGFVGWSVYQIMQSRSGGPMYTDVSGNLGSLYSGKGILDGPGACNCSSAWIGIQDTVAAKCILLANALLPVGKTLYVWGGGHNWSDATRKGISPKWKQWYDSNSSSYNYRYYMDLSEATEQKGLDCSGFVGWSVYQIMQSRSGGPMYTDVSGNLGSLYSGKGILDGPGACNCSSAWIGIQDTVAAKCILLAIDRLRSRSHDTG